MNTGDIVFMWENYHTNYAQKIRENNAKLKQSYDELTSSERDAAATYFDYEQDSGGQPSDEEKARLYNFVKQNRTYMEHSPFGEFEENDPLSYVNMYENIWLVHFSGANMTKYPKLSSAVMEINGVALIKPLDNHCFAIVISKIITDVSAFRTNFEKEFINYVQEEDDRRAKAAAEKDTTEDAEEDSADNSTRRAISNNMADAFQKLEKLFPTKGEML